MLIEPVAVPRLEEPDASDLVAQRDAWGVWARATHGAKVRRERVFIRRLRKPKRSERHMQSARNLAGLRERGGSVAVLPCVGYLWRDRSGSCDVTDREPGAASCPRQHGRVDVCPRDGHGPSLCVPGSTPW